ncbi:MAG TPA: SRPBCC family protein [Solirubrobacteraceae bacterium]|nr:SRPBCC family protein [Solirubrobacteraceae bacterium]
MRVARSRTLAAPVDDVWRVLEDPYALPRWWPLVRRVEGVSAVGWTMVLGREGGRGVRADQRLEASEAPALRRWALDVPGSPFERVLQASAVEARLAPAGDGAELTLELRQAPRGFARLGALMLRRAGRRQLDDALEGMARAVEP